jgi:hypothetical protein
MTKSEHTCVPFLEGDDWCLCGNDLTIFYVESELV